MGQEVYKMAKDGEADIGHCVSNILGSNQAFEAAYRLDNEKGEGDKSALYAGVAVYIARQMDGLLSGYQNPEDAKKTKAYEALAQIYARLQSKSGDYLKEKSD